MSSNILKFLNYLLYHFSCLLSHRPGWRIREKFVHKMFHSTQNGPSDILHMFYCCHNIGHLFNRERLYGRLPVHYGGNTHVKIWCDILTFSISAKHDFRQKISYYWHLMVRALLRWPKSSQKFQFANGNII